MSIAYEGDQFMSIVIAGLKIQMKLFLDVSHLSGEISLRHNYYCTCGQSSQALYRGYQAGYSKSSKLLMVFLNSEGGEF